MTPRCGRIGVHLALALTGVVVGAPAALSLQLQRTLPREFWLVHDDPPGSFGDVILCAAPDGAPLTSCALPQVLVMSARDAENADVLLDRCAQPGLPQLMVPWLGDEFGVYRADGSPADESGGGWIRYRRVAR